MGLGGTIHGEGSECAPWSSGSSARRPIWFGAAGTSCVRGTCRPDPAVDREASPPPGSEPLATWPATCRASPWWTYGVRVWCTYHGNCHCGTTRSPEPGAQPRSCSARRYWGGRPAATTGTVPAVQCRRSPRASRTRWPPGTRWSWASAARTWGWAPSVAWVRDAWPTESPDCWSGSPAIPVPTTSRWASKICPVPSLYVMPRANKRKTARIPEKPVTCSACRTRYYNIGVL